MTGGALISVGFIWQGNISTNLNCISLAINESIDEGHQQQRQNVNPWLLELDGLGAVHPQSERSLLTRFEGCGNNQIASLIQLRPVAHLSTEKKKQTIKIFWQRALDFIKMATTILPADCWCTASWRDFWSFWRKLDWWGLNRWVSAVDRRRSRWLWAPEHCAGSGKWRPRRHRSQSDAIAD